MRTILKTLLQILDGTPRPQRIGQRGQSLIEMTVITPLIAIMIMGIVEIGWYANHYMIILEVSRVGARQGTLLQGGEVGPLAWDDNASVHPNIFPELQLDGSVTGWYYTYRNNTDMTGAGWAPDTHESNGGTMPVAAGEARGIEPDCSDLAVRNPGYYTTIACTMVRSMDPLGLRYDFFNVLDRYGNVVRTVDYPDDIVISLFTLQKIYNANPAAVSETEDHYPQTINLGTNYPPGHRVIVVGRYPANANECDIYLTSPSSGDFRDGGVFITETVTNDGSIPDAYDPFDYNRDGVRNQTTLSLGDGKFRTIFTELRDPDTTPEIQRGFSWTGQHFIEQTAVPPGGSQAYPLLCFGSDWSEADVEDLMNNTEFFDLEPRPRREDYNSDAAFQNAVSAWDTNYGSDAILQDELSHLPGQGLVLVELHWHHDTLLNFPFLVSFLNLFGDMQNVTISAWAAFPVPTIEPNLVYQIPAS